MQVGGRAGSISTINVTPMADIMIVLLIIDPSRGAECPGGLPRLRGRGDRPHHEPARALRWPEGLGAPLDTSAVAGLVGGLGGPKVGH